MTEENIMTITIRNTSGDLIREFLTDYYRLVSEDAETGRCFSIHFKEIIFQKEKDCDEKVTIESLAKREYEAHALLKFGKGSGSYTEVSKQIIPWENLQKAIQNQWISHCINQLCPQV